MAWRTPRVENPESRVQSPEPRAEGPKSRAESGEQEVCTSQFKIRNRQPAPFNPRLSILVALLAALSLSGCKYVVLLGYLIGGPPSIEPDFEATTGQSMTDRGVTVAVVCYAPPELQWDFDDLDQEVGKYVSYRLAEHHIDTRNPDVVHAWIDQHPDWDTPEEIGEALEVDYVIYIDMHKYSLYEKNSANLYRGRSEMMVSAIEMHDDGTGEKIYTKDVTSKYPIRVPRSTSEVTYATFKRQYLTRLSEEIGRLFYPYYAGDDISAAT